MYRLNVAAIVTLVLCFSGSDVWSQDEVEKKVVGKNVLSNSSFEELSSDNPSGWEKKTWSGSPLFKVETEFGHTGDHCVKISSKDGADASWSQRVELKPNTEYRLSVWIKTDSIGAEGFGAQLNLHELQFEGKSDALKGTNDWKQIVTEFNSGAHTSLLVNCLFGGWGRATGTAWFDDLELVRLEQHVEVPKMTEEEALVFFEQKVRPVFEEKCFKCHGAGEKIKGGFVMTNREDLLAGGESGAAIDLESPLDSLILEAINYESYEMPPSGKLPAEDIVNITAWIQVGAPWSGSGHKPEMEAESGIVPPEVNAETKKFWAYQKPTQPLVPHQHDPWITNEIDQFIFHDLNKNELKPNPIASKQTLIRRAYYDLTGLPPSPEKVESFLNDDSPEAYENLIDELLDSKHYGEKWARHWLDLVRYAESNSYERDGTKPFVWRYRDYVIRALNDDKPYDQFVIEQLAGDELEVETPDAIIATGYYRLGRWDDEPVDHEQAWFDDMDDVLKTTGQAFLGMTVDCARCHDHKIDPIPQADYYSMLSFFRNVQRYGVRGHDTVLRQSTRTIASQEEREKHSQEVENHNNAIAENQKALEAIEVVVKKDFIDVEHEEFKHDMNRVPLVEKRIGKTIDGNEFTEDQAKRYKILFTEMRRLRRERPRALEAALCVTEKGDSAPETFVLVRGNSKAKGDKVQPAFPSVLSPPSAEIVKPSDGQSTGRRLALAKWIASPENPLTARVMVNRIWQHHFGRGIVKSSNDFGFQGTPPTHPELLDWLAKDFVDGGWKLKRFHKMLMMSSTYRMSSAPQEAGLAKDPVNDLFWRFNMRRLTAEEVRDSILAVNGTINLDKMYGPSIFPEIPPEILQGQSRPGENWGKSSSEDIVRRSIYIHLKRSLPVPIMASFDVADTDSSCPVRFNTVQPTQALGMLNSKFINEEAAKLAAHITETAGDDAGKFITVTLQTVLQRKPTENEIQMGFDFLDQMKSMGHDPNKARELFSVVALNLNEFLYLD